MRRRSATDPPLPEETGSYRREIMTTNLKFIDVPKKSADPVVRARESLNLRLAEQIARAKDPQMTKERRKGKGDDRKTIQVPIPPWFTQKADGKVILTIKAGGKKATAIEIPNMEQFESHVTALMKAVSEGALDQFLGRRPFQKKASTKPALVGKKRAA
jgi:hypothetical protein